MCIAVIAHQAHPRWQLVVAANRDEYHERPAAPLARWEDAPQILAGRDLKGGGTWLGVSEAGRLVLITNFRTGQLPDPARPSRGALVSGLLAGEDPEAVALSPYNPFSLFVADRGGQLHMLSSHPVEQRLLLEPGVHGLSNGPFQPPWPKTQRLAQMTEDWLGGRADDFMPLLNALRDESPHDSPGDGPEPRMSGVFIRDPLYGTRCSTVAAIDRLGRGRIIERRFDAGGVVTGETVLDFSWAD